MTKLLPTWEELDLLVDTDPIKLRDVAWELVCEIKKLQPTAPVHDKFDWR